MRELCVFCVVLLIATAFADNQPTYEQHKKALGLKFNTPEEDAYRASVYAANVRLIRANNNDPKSTHKEGVNQFTTMTQAQFVGKMLTLQIPIVNVPSIAVPNVSVPTVSIPNIPVPNVYIPSISVPTVSIPNIPVPNVYIPSISVPNINVPNIAVPSISLPNIAIPNIAIPSIAVPDIAVPNIAIPNIAIPDIAVPNIAIPSINVPDISLSTTLTVGDWTAVNVDWATTPGAVTPVRNQGQCGSCWAFSACASMESLNFLKGAAQVDLSEQQLVSCSRSYGNKGCSGGWTNSAFNYVLAGGITMEALYPYTATNSKCTTNGGAFKILGYTNVATTCPDLANALVGQPLSVAVAATPWKSYSSGILSTCDNNVNHAVLLVGVNPTYYKIKNSWGATAGASQASSALTLQTVSIPAGFALMPATPPSDSFVEYGYTFSISF